MTVHQFDTVICMNVLEHIEDDRRALINMHSVRGIRRRAVLLLPASNFLYGTVDRALDHYRRYTKRDLLPRLREAGFEVEAAFYMNLIGMVGWFVNNRVLKRTQESPPQILFFDRFVAPWAERIERVLPPPIGFSLIAVGRKTDCRS